MPTLIPPETIDLTDETPHSFTGQFLEYARAALDALLEISTPLADTGHQPLHSSGYCLWSPLDNQPQLTHKLFREFHRSCRVADARD
jgi:hypothetical protein